MRLSCNLQCEQTERWESVVNIQARRACFYFAEQNYSVNVICCLYERIKRIFAYENIDKHVTHMTRTIMMKVYYVVLT